MLATLAEECPTGQGWMLRGQMRRLPDARVRSREGGATRSRTGTDYTERFDNVARALPTAIKTPDCVLDGEVCAIDEQGRTSFSAMQKGGGPLVYYVFDLLEVEGAAARSTARSSSGAQSSTAFSTAGTGRSSSRRLSRTGPAWRRRRRQQGLEGIIAKQAQLALRAGPPLANWLKVKPARHARSSSSPATRRGRAGGRPARLARPRRQSGRTASSTSGTAAPGSRRRRSSKL